MMLSAIITVLASATLKADLGSCLVYHAAFYLHDGTNFKGCFEVSGYNNAAYLDDNGINPFCNDKGVLELFKRKARENGKVYLYKNLHYISLKPLRLNAQAVESKYGFVDAADVVLLDSNSVVSITFQSVEYSKRDWVNSRIIVGSKGMLDSTMQERYWDSLVFATKKWSASSTDIQDYDFDETPFPEFVLYNYNPNINREELKRLIRLKIPVNFYEALAQELMRKNNLKRGPEESQIFRQLYEEASTRRLRKIQDWFWEKGILLIRINGTC